MIGRIGRAGGVSDLVLRSSSFVRRAAGRQAVNVMRIGAGLSTETDPREAAEAAMVARRSLDEARTSLALVFASPHHAARASALLDAVHEACRPEALIGCVGEAVLGGRRGGEGGARRGRMAGRLG